MIQSPKAVVTLVNGSWAAHAEWLEPSSIFFSHLVSSLPGPVLTNVFRWPGKNTASSRESAARELAFQLRKLVADYPQARHYVVGHSHGGNIALKAVETADLFEYIGVICLSTPFFHIRPKAFGARRERTTWQLGFGLGGGVLWLFLYYLVFHDISHSGPLPFFAGFPFFILATLLFGRWFKGSEAVAGSLVVNVPAGARLLIMRSVGDESAMTMSTFQFGGWLMMTIMSAYTKAASTLHMIAESCERFFAGIRRPDTKLFFATCLCLCASLLLAFRPAGNLPSVLLSVALVLPLAFFVLVPMSNLIAIAILVLAVTGITPLLVLLILFTVLSQGRDAALTAAAFYEVTVDPMPGGEWMVHPIVVKDTQSSSRSSTYEDESALIAIQRWIEKGSESTRFVPLSVSAYAQQRPVSGKAEVSLASRNVRFW